MTGSGGVTRRSALGLIAGAGAAAMVAGCSSSSSSPSAHQTPSTGAGSGSSRPSGQTAHGPTHSDWKSLKHKLSGTVRRPNSSGYDEARLLFDRRFDAVLPAAVATVASDSDVAHCLDFAKAFNLGLRVRSGGHSYIGASIGPGLVIDLRDLKSISDRPGTATIGAGAALIDVYSQLAAQGVSIPAGSCPSVGLSGLALGGGVGVVGRRYGLTCDVLHEAAIVTANGNVVTCNADSNADLYWALRGGGGSFGVVTSLTFNTHDTEPLAHAYVAWPWSAAAEVVAAWQTWAIAAPKTLWSSAHVLANGPGSSASISVAAVMVDSTAALQQHIGDLTQAISASPTTNFLTTESYGDTMMLEAGCSTQTVAQCHIADETPGGTLPRDAFVAGSDFFKHPIPSAGISALVAAVEHRQSDPRLGTGGASFDILGGAIDHLADDATAWSHRGALFNAQYTASWGDTAGNGPLARNQHSLARIHGALRPYATGEAYQNYADDTLSNPQQAYYGGNLAKLIDIKRQYDPSNLFAQPQGVPLT